MTARGKQFVGGLVMGAGAVYSLRRERGEAARWRPVSYGGGYGARLGDIAGLEAEALQDRAPLDLRINALKSDRAALQLPVAGEALPTAYGLRLPFGTHVEAWDAYRGGLIEVQDCGSQLACEAVGACARRPPVA